MKRPYLTAESRYLPLLNGGDEEVDKPAEGVLVHGIDVGQVGDTEEQHGGMLCDGAITFARFSYFQFRFLCNLHINSS